jgi:hypothetical protein
MFWGVVNFSLAVCLALVAASIIYFGQHKFIYSDHNFNSSLFEKATEASAQFRERVCHCWVLVRKLDMGGWEGKAVSSPRES